MPRYEVQFKTSGIVAFSATERAICQHWYECNNFGPDGFERWVSIWSDAKRASLARAVGLIPLSDYADLCIR